MKLVLSLLATTSIFLSASSYAASESCHTIVDGSDRFTCLVYTTVSSFNPNDSDVKTRRLELAKEYGLSPKATWKDITDHNNAVYYKEREEELKKAKPKDDK